MAGVGFGTSGTSTVLGVKENNFLDKEFLLILN